MRRIGVEEGSYRKKSRDIFQLSSFLASSRTRDVVSSGFPVGGKPGKSKINRNGEKNEKSGVDSRPHGSIDPSSCDAEDILMHIGERIRASRVHPRYDRSWGCT